MALLTVMTLCLLVYAVIEWRVRQALQLHQQSLPDQKGQATQRPTARWVFQYFSGIRLLKVMGVQTLVPDIHQHHKAVLDLLGNRYAEL